ncbi:OLC1v1035653C1 [Oldenlandia corymbosa var. corymbosa]|uniref:Purple acid phosphatase n=1 Tax=Oldenlandia corymbosa var. corymbosa TaxID=529605 RepID=A0AAV1CTJ9_OLDCO|nr:OLC1v1035653C1 [Oldenlandia corymbosa var. corymbosa]
MKALLFTTIYVFCFIICAAAHTSINKLIIHGGEQPLAQIAIHKTVLALRDSASIKSTPLVLGLNGADSEWVTVELCNSEPAIDDWIGVFNPSQVQPQLIAVSNTIAFANPKAPVYPRLARGKAWDEMTVTWTSGYNIDEAYPFVEWGMKGDATPKRSPAGTLTFNQGSLCGPPARTVGWRHPGYIHTSFLKDLWPNMEYYYKLGHILMNGSIVWSKSYSFRASPFPGQESLQRVIIFGDMGKAERDGSNEHANYQPGSLMTTDQLINDLDNIDIVFLIGDLPYANGYISQWDQFTAQVAPITSVKPFMIASGNHERDWLDSGSFFNTKDSGGECGVPAETLYYFPAENRAKFWYQTDYGMFRFCIIDSEHDWREGSEQYKFIEKCLATADRKHQPWLIFAAHRPLGYSSNDWYANEGSFEEPEGRAHLQKLWQKYRVDIAFFGHVHNYERVCPIYQNQCVKEGTSHYSGVVNGTIHVVAGGGGSHLSQFTKINTFWSIYKDYDWGFVKLTAFNRSSLLFENKKSSDGKVYDSFTISRDYRDVLACVHDGCEATTLAT